MTISIVRSMQPYDATVVDRSVFLAGGTRDCPNWRVEAIELFGQTWAAAMADQSGAERLTLTLFTPWRIEGVSQFLDEFVFWENRHLNGADLVLLWFPRGFSSRPVQPIALYELGTAAASGKVMVVGADPDYARRPDVVAQMRCARPDLVVHADLASTVEAAVAELLAGACAPVTGLTLRRHRTMAGG
jgi:hypothetical protein